MRQQKYSHRPTQTTEICIFPTKQVNQKPQITTSGHPVYQEHHQLSEDRSRNGDLCTLENVAGFARAGKSKIMGLMGQPLIPVSTLSFVDLGPVF